MRTADERTRRAERGLDAEDAAAVRRLVSERERVEDPLGKLAGAVERARALYADVHFTLKIITDHIGYTRSRAAKSAETGHPREGFLWVRDWGASSAGLHKFAKPEHAAKFREPGAGVIAPPMCEVCGAVGLVGGVCVVPASEAEGLERSSWAVTWWRGTRSSARDKGIRHFALVVWDGDAGIAGIAVGTGTSRQRVSSVFPILKKKRSEAYRPIDKARVRAWMLEADRNRVVMTLGYAEGLGGAKS